MSTQAELTQSIYTGFIDGEAISLEQYRPKLLVNNSDAGQKVLTSIIKELNQCDEFFFSVAFITQSGVTILLNTLKELEAKGIHGKIVASQYLNFTDPKALRRLLEFKNIEVKVVTDQNLHAKGYLFRKNDHYSIIVGSSNLTQEALSKNREWNLKISSMDQGSIIKQTMHEFEETFRLATKVDDEWIDAYSKIYDQQKASQKSIDYPLILRSNSMYGTPSKTLMHFENIMPNKMQIKALEGIEKIRLSGEKKTLLISATGTGKTYLSAFDVKKYKPKKFLFLAHREQILNQSIESYQKIIGYDLDYGMIGGGKKELYHMYTFSTVFTMSKPEVLKLFSKDYFDYIIIDESHHVGAESYQRILGYFEPDFLLGMTATPERTDGHNIFNDFDYNIAYEIRLQEAMREEMLCPFHYFGISELTIDGEVIDEKTEFNRLVAIERVRNIINHIEYYGFHGERVKGLVFCSRNDEAQKLSELFNQNGYKTVALSGSNSQDEREEAIERLEQNERNNHLDYIFTVDIFNEGVDIPSINQVIMLRPTQSAIVFVQQLGRGLRKAADKEYVVILDFIGNYENNFMIPIALSDDRSYNKDTVRRFVSEGSRVIPGCSTIQFDTVAKKKIFESIDQVDRPKFVKQITESYQILKYRLGRIPNLMDFEEHDSLDMALIIDSFGSYYHFLKKKDKDYEVDLDDTQSEWIKFISTKLAIGKRPHELLILRDVIQGKTDLLKSMRQKLENDYDIKVKDKTLKNVVNVLTNEFTVSLSKKTFSKCIFIQSSGDDYVGADTFVKALEDPEFKTMITELVDYGLFRNLKYFGERYKNSSFQLYQKYSYEDVCRLLEWEKNEVSLNIGGYKYDERSKTFPVFINYHKDEAIQSSIKYEDRFESPEKLIALSKSKRTLESNDMQTIMHSEELGVDIELFVRKNKDDNASKEFYYLGKIHPAGKLEQKTMADTGHSVVEIPYQLERAVREDLYEYITEA